MSKRSHAPAISLFSFQDIITSITGIMFLVVLLLLLFILEVDPKKPDVNLSEQYSQASARIEELRRLLSSNRGMEKELQEKLYELQKNDPRQLSQRLEALSSELVQLEAGVDPRHQELQKFERQLKELKKVSKEAEARLNDLQEQARKSTQRVEDLKKNLAKAECQEQRREHLMPYTVDSSLGTSPIIAECGADGIRAITVADRSIHDFRCSNVLTYFESVEAFMGWVRTLDALQVYFCLLIKPVAFQYAELLSSQLKAAGFQRGLEVMPSNESTIFEEE